MRVLVENKSEGLVGLVGQRVTFFCMNYIYTGKLVGINSRDLKLEEASIVYETGSFSDSTWKDSQKLPHALYIRLSSIESYMVLK